MALKRIDCFSLTSTLKNHLLNASASPLTEKAAKRGTSKGDRGPTERRGMVGLKVTGNSLYSVSVSLFSFSGDFSIDVWDAWYVNLSPSLEQPLLCTAHKTLNI